MARKGKRNARILLEEHRCEATVRVVARPEVGPRGLFTVEILDPLCPLARIWPQLFLGEEVVGATGNAQDAYVRGIRISVDLRGELGVRGEVAVAGIEVPLRVQERDVHPAILSLSLVLSSTRPDSLAGWRVPLRGRSPKAGCLWWPASALLSPWRNAPSVRPSCLRGWP